MLRQYGRYIGETVHRTISATGAWVASANLADIQLDKDLLITNVSLQAHMTCTLAATALTDGPKRALQGLTIVGDGKNFLALTGGTTEQLGVLLALLNQYDMGCSGQGQYLDVGSTTFDQMYNFHPGNNKKDKFDLSACIPAKALSNLVAKINCPVAAAVDSGANITAGTYTIEIDGVQGVPIQPDMLIPASYVQAIPVTAAALTTFDIPTGGYVRRAILLNVDNTAVAALKLDTQVTAVAFRDTTKNKTLISQNWMNLKFDNARRYGVVGDDQPIVMGAVAGTRTGYDGSIGLPLGFGIVDFRDYAGDEKGLNTIGAQQGWYKLDLTFGAATGFTFILWDIVVPPDPMWVGK